MKYFTEKWYKSKENINANEYYDYMRSNYAYYPQWFRAYNVVDSGSFLFHDAMIDEIVYSKNDIVINLVGHLNPPDEKFNYPYGRSFSLILSEAEFAQKPDVADAMDVVAEELYCSADGCELHMLLIDDESFELCNLTAKCKSIAIEYEKISFMFYVKFKFIELFNNLKKENRRKKKIRKRRNRLNNRQK